MTSPRLLTIDNTASNVDLTRFPLYVSLDPSRIDYSKVADPTTDLKFHDMSSNTDVVYEVDHWNFGGDSGVWVLMPNMHMHATEHVLMSFGAGVGIAYDPTAVWIDNFQLVEHLEPALANSAGTGHSGTLAGATLGAGKLGGGMVLAGGSNERITFASDTSLFDGWNKFTLELWIRADYPNAAALSGEPHFMEKGTSLDLPRLFNSAGPLQLQVDFNYVGNGDITVNTDLNVQTWSYIVYTFVGDQDLMLYQDGALSNMSFNLGADQLKASTMPFLLGSSGAAINGVLDEVRISTTGHTVSWVHAQYLAMTDQSVTFGAP